MWNKFARRGRTHWCAGCCFVAAAMLSFSPLHMSPLRADEVLFIAPEVWQGFQEYKRYKHPKVFAVSANGLAYGYSYCPDYRCKLTPDARTLALNSCVQGGGKACRVFAVGTDIKVQYKIATLVPELPPAGQGIEVGCSPAWWGSFVQEPHPDNEWVEMLRAADDAPKPPGQKESCLDVALAALTIHLMVLDANAAESRYGSIVTRALGSNP